MWKLQLRVARDAAGERVFADEFLRNLNLALPIKKGAGVADRVIRFVANYVKFAVEKDTGGKLCLAPSKVYIS